MHPKVWRNDAIVATAHLARSHGMKRGGRVGRNPIVNGRIIDNRVAGRDFIGTVEIERRLHGDFPNAPKGLAQHETISSSGKVFRVDGGFRFWIRRCQPQATPAFGAKLIGVD